MLAGPAVTKQRLSACSWRRPCSAAECELHEHASTYLCGKLIQPYCPGPGLHVGAAPARERSAGAAGAARGVCQLSQRGAGTARSCTGHELRIARRGAPPALTGSSRAACGGMMMASACQAAFRFLKSLRPSFSPSGPDQHKTHSLLKSCWRSE